MRYLSIACSWRLGAGICGVSRAVPAMSYGARAAVLERNETASARGAYEEGDLEGMERVGWQRELRCPPMITPCGKG